MPYCIQCGKPVAKWRRKYCSIDCLMESRIQKGNHENVINNKCQYCGKDLNGKILTLYTGYCDAKCYRSQYNKDNPDKKREASKITKSKYKKNCYGKYKERKLLYNHFGTTILPSEIKKQHALLHIGKRICQDNGDIPINNDEINEMIDMIERGETYAAYEKSLNKYTSKIENEKINTHKKTNKKEWRKKNYEKFKKWRLNNPEKAKKIDKANWLNNKETKTKYNAKYRREHKDEINLKARLNRQIYKEKYVQRERDYRKKNKEKIRFKRVMNNDKTAESSCLYRMFGTVQLPLEIKKQMALYHLGKRIIKYGPVRPIEQTKIVKIIDKIEKGETHAAYK